VSVSSFGEELKRERELREITLREISEATKINLRYLEALERNDFERLPGGVFNKGFVRAYAEYIGVDPETMVNAYLLEERGQQSERVDGLSEDLFRPAQGSAIRSHTTPDSPAGDAGRGVLAKAAVVVVAVGVLAAATFLIWWWRGGAGDGSTPDSPAPVEPTIVTEPAPESLTSTAETERGEEPPDEASSAASVASIPAPDRVVPEPPPVDRDEPAVEPPGAGVPQVRVVLARSTQGRLNCDNKRVEILDGLAEGTEMVFRCREFLLVDALDGGAVLVQPEGFEATPLGPDGLPVVGRYVVPARPRSSGGEP
jgi:cytoskeletal protein RodZ